jgi:chromosome segregation ATPase
MTALNKQALRKLAKALSGKEWVAFVHKASGTYAIGSLGHERGEDIIKWPGFDGQDNAESKAKFIAAASPATVLALLDELEAAQHEKDELQQGFIANQEEAHEAIKYATELKEQLARACAGREEAFREVDEMQKSLDHTHRRRSIWRRRAGEAEDKLEAAEKRITDCHTVLNNLAAVARRYLPDYDEHPDIQAADDLLESAAGIGVKGE